MYIDDIDTETTSNFYGSSLESGRVITGLEEKTNGVFQTRLVKAEWEAQAGATLSWGGKDGPTVEGSAQFNVSDNKGNYGKVEIRQHSRGQGDLSVSGGHKSERRKSSK